MGTTTRNLAYNQGTNTLTGTAVQDQEVWVHVDGSMAAFAKGRSSPVTGAFSIVLTGLAAGAHTVRTSCNGTSLIATPLSIVKT